MRFRKKVIQALKDKGLARDSSTADRIVSCVFQELERSVIESGYVHLRSLFTIKIKWRKPTRLHNPKTGGVIHKPGSAYLKTTWSKNVIGKLKERWTEDAVKKNINDRNKRTGGNFEAPTSSN